MSPPSFGRGLGDGHDVRHPLDRVRQLADGVLRVRAGDHVGCYRQGCVVALPEGGRDLVVGLALGGGRRCRAVVRQRETHAGGGHRRQGEETQHPHDREHREPSHGAHPDGPEARAGRLRLALAGLLLGRAGWARPQSLAEQQRDRRHQRQGDDDSDRDRRRSSQSHHGQHRDPRHGEPGERDDHGGSGEHDRAACRGEGARHRLGRRQSLGQVSSVPREDEQGVVDPHGQPQHLRECRRVAGNGRQ